MQDKLNQAQNFRARAEQLRSIASGLSRADERELLIQLAREYDAMARSAATTARLQLAKAIHPDSPDERTGKQE